MINHNNQIYSITDVVEITGLGRTSIYKAIKDGGLTAKKFGNRTLIPAASLDAWIDNLPEMGGV